MKRFVYLSGLVIAAAVGTLWMIPGETFVQFGLRKIAVEQGVAQASRHHSWEAAADAEAEQVARVEDDEPVRKPTPSKRGKR